MHTHHTTRPYATWSFAHSRPQCLRVCECARKLWETLRRRRQNLAIWASQGMIFDPAKTFCFLSTSSRRSCAALVLELIKIQLTEPLKNFQVPKTLVRARMFSLFHWICRQHLIPLTIPCCWHDCRNHLASEELYCNGSILIFLKELSL